MKKRTIIQMFMILLLVLAPAKALALEITSTSPSGTLLHSNVMLEAATDVNSECNYLVGSFSGALNGNTTAHSKQITLDDGEYTAYFSCGNGNGSDTAETNFKVDTLPPTITLSNFPEEITNQPFQAKITTSESADCKYSETQTEYAFMQNFMEKLNSKSHYIIINGKAQGFYTYNIACKDETNKINTMQREFFINQAPTAQISIEKEDPLSAGLYEVTLLSSEILSQTPSLSYSFGGVNRGISLTKTNEGWKGYMLIEEEDGTSVATFSFRGIDASGLEGREISQGKVFLIDTERPIAVDSLIAIPESDEINLEWSYEEEYESFIIFRSTDPDVSKTEEYKTVTERKYSDTDIDEGETYFYKIAAVDEAGNIGILSEELEVLALEHDKDKNSGLSASLSYQLDEEISDAESELFDYESAIRDMQRNNNGYVAKIDARYGVSTNINSAVNTLKEIISEMEDMFTVEYSESEYSKRIAKYREQRSNLRKNTPIEINILDEKTVTLSADDAAISSAINEYLLGTEMSEEERENFTLSMTELQSKITVVASIVTAELVTSVDDEKITYVEKKVSASSPIDKASVIEIIPKEFARTASQIKFSNNPIILQEDPVVQWDLSSLSSQEFSYSLDEQKNTNLISLTDTVVLTRPVIKEKEVPVATGNVVAEENEEGGAFWKYFFLIFFVLVISGLAGYYFYFNKPTIDPEIETAFESKKISNILQSGHEAANNIQVDKAKTLYMQAYQLYVILDTSKKTGVYPSLNSLHNKLMLLNSLGKAHDALDEKDDIKYRQSMIAINALKNDVVQGTALMNYLESSFEYFGDRRSLA